MEMSGIEEGSSAKSEPNQDNPYLNRQGLFSYNDWDSKSPKLDDVALTSKSNTKNQEEIDDGSGKNNCDSMPSEQGLSSFVEHMVYMYLNFCTDTLV